MEARGPIVIRHGEREVAPGPATPGMDRRQLMDHGDRWVGWVQTEPDLAGGWHHHGQRDSYIYVQRGDVIIEWGPAGREHVTAHAGDVIFNPSGMIHREITGPYEPAELFVIRIGPGPLNVNVDAPDPA